MNPCYICDRNTDVDESHTIDLLTYTGEHITQEVCNVCYKDINLEFSKLNVSDALDFFE